LGLDYVIQYKKEVENKATDALLRLEVRGKRTFVMVVIEILPAWLEDSKLSYLDYFSIAR
jgi:hypothetical protein